uniref:Uncharacterized protein n=1 Tax=Clastoptera arizonana TaxID=38151 RepID=A0A1B6E0R4_9HEMI
MQSKVLVIFTIALCLAVISESSVAKTKKKDEAQQKSAISGSSEESKEAAIYSEMLATGHVRVPRSPKINLPYSIPHRHGLQYRKKVYPNRNQLGRVDRRRMKERAA